MNRWRQGTATPKNGDKIVYRDESPGDDWVHAGVEVRPGLLDAPEHELAKMIIEDPRAAKN